MSSETLLIGGGNGGKSTFTGGLLYYLEEESDRKWNPEFRYNSQEIKEKIYEKMIAENTYPAKTENPYLLRLHLYYDDSVLKDETVFDIMDIPGERLRLEPPADEGPLSRIKKSIRGAKTHRKKLSEQYELKIKPELESASPAPTPKMWKQLFQYRYLRSDTVVCMLNLNKLMNPSRNDPLLVQKPEKLLRLMRPKDRKLILISACDTIGYDPSTFDGDGSFLRGTIQDHDLVDALEHSLTLNQREKLRTLSDNVLTSGSDLSFFGISVDAENPDDYEDSTLAGPRGQVETKGMEQVIQWLLA